MKGIPFEAMTGWIAFRWSLTWIFSEVFTALFYMTEVLYAAPGFTSSPLSCRCDTRGKWPLLNNPNRSWCFYFFTAVHGSLVIRKPFHLLILIAKSEPWNWYSRTSKLLEPSPEHCSLSRLIVHSKLSSFLMRNSYLWSLGQVYCMHRLA